MVFKYDFLIIGAGVAGMSYALKIARAHKGKVCIICKTSLDEANTSFAQGGVASVTNLAVDNFDKHIEDTMIAGDYINDRRAVEQVVRNAPEQIRELVNWGVNFDRKEDGSFAVVFIFLAVLVACHLALHEVVVVVDEVHLKACLRNGGYLDDERVVGVVDYKVHARKAYHLM